MKVNLNKDSWHFQYYKFLTMTEGVPIAPKSLCPYFWSLVFLTFALPVILIAKMVLAAMERSHRSTEEARSKWTPEQWDMWSERRKKKQESYQAIMPKVGKACLALALTALAAMLIYGCIMLTIKGDWLKFLLEMGKAFAIASIVFGIIWIISKKGGAAARWIRRSFLVNFVGGMIYAAYNKACPIIQWEEEAKSENTNLA